MKKSPRAKFNMIALSAGNMETGLNVFQTVDLSVLAAMSDMISLTPRKETNKDEMTGMEEPDSIYDLGNTSGMSLTFEKAQPQHFALLLAFALGVVNTTAAGAGYLHTITPIDTDLEEERSLPSFTAAQRLGKTVARMRYASMFVNSVTATFARDSWCKVVGEIIGTGKFEASVIEESITAQEDATTLTLAANGVAGSTAQERLDSIHQIRVETSAGVWEEVAFSVVSAATPAEITITAPGATTDNKTYKVLYAPTEVAWMTFPARINETPLRVSDFKFKIGAKWDGSEFQGGRDMGAELNAVEYKFVNPGAVEFTPGGGGDYASSYFRGDREQVLTVDREFRDYIIQNYMHSNETFGIQILAEGMEFDTGHKYGVEIIIPKLGVMEAPISVGDKKLGEKGSLQVLQDATYGSVIVRVKNLQSGYAQ